MRFSSSFAAVVSTTLVVSSVAAKAQSAITHNVHDVTSTTWDWIIVGAGLGGLVTANRLSANPDTKVLVVEAGLDNRTSYLVQSINTYGQGWTSDLTWKYQAENQVGGTKTVHAGKALGGSTSINGGAWGRPARAQFDALASYTGDQSWTWDKLLPYLKMAEHFHAPTDKQRALGAGVDWDVHGFDGPIDVSYTPAYDGPEKRVGSSKVSVLKRMYTDSYGQDFLTAAKKAIGLEQSYDCGNGLSYGSGGATTNSITPVSGKPTGELRSSSATGYLSPIEFNRPNLKVLVNHRGVEPLFENSTQPTKVTGAVVQGSQGGKKFHLKAKHGVIVSAGALGSPQFLERGGIGDPAILKPLGIQVKVDLPGVGKNLQDQTQKSLAAQPKTAFAGHGPSATIVFPNIYQLFPHNATAMRTHLQSQYDTWAASTVKRGGSINTDVLKAQWKVMENLIWDQKIGAFEGFVDHGFPEGGLGVDCWNLLPFARGSVHITSTDAYSNAKIDPGYWTVPIDLDLSVAGWRAMRQIYHTAPLNGTVERELIPGKAVPMDAHYGSYNDWTKWGTGDYSAVSHQAGTLQMAPRNQGGVVAPDGTVYGVAQGSLRVIDASVMPFLLNSHISAPLYGMTEKLAQDVVSATHP